ncbi:hypothetical protein BT246_39560 [Bacillus thuringiensis]|uniref:HNH nuclease domain-containing protein n=1 Tax=Bacillus thuringiensis TaxID=1428 RepID=A0A9W3SDT5_BACTU|nr:hypothetical protein BT246_39560 [Bacillus thuringiensis]
MFHLTERLTYEEVSQTFKDAGCVLLSDNYVRARDKLKYRCNCGNISEISLDKFKSGQRCRECKGKRISDKTRHSYEYIKEFFESNGCKLLTKDYKGNKQKVKYVCTCGSEAYITFAKFQAGQRCVNCKFRRIGEKLRGSNSPLWNPNKTMEERIMDRHYPDYRAWRSAVFKRDGYTCQFCGEVGGTLNAHHIMAYAEFHDLRTDINNGITLCEECHKCYHKMFTVQYAEGTSFREFMKGDWNEPWYAGEKEVMWGDENDHS